MTTIWFDIDILVAKIDTAILYKARNIKKDGSSDFVQLSIADAKLFIRDKVKSIALKVYDKLVSPLARHLTDTFLFDEEIDGKKLLLIKLDYTIDLNLLPAIEGAIEDVIIDYCIYEWMYHSNYDWRKGEERFNGSWDDLLSLIKRRINLKRTYKLY